MAQRRRKKKRRSQAVRRIIPVLVVILLILLVAGGIAVGRLIKKYSPSKEEMDLAEYFGIESSEEVAVIFNNELTDIKGRLIDDEVYLTTDVLYEYLNSRFYWDSQENLLLYTTPTELITAEVGSSTYTVAKTSYTESYDPVRVDGDTAYVALAYIQKYTAVSYSLAGDSQDGVYRVVISTEFGSAETVTVRKNTAVRYQAGIKSDILTHVLKGDVLYVLEEDEDVGEWTKVRTSDGIIGYIQNKYLGEGGTEVTEANYEEPEYTSITKDYTINMAWHQVTNSDANSTVLEMIADTKGLTTISPTWFFLCDDDGNIESIASSTYVNYCHQNDIEVWALVEDITYADTITDYEILSKTSSRQNLVTSLVAKAIEYDIDGLNIDLEYITEESADAYLEFLRELSIMCRLNGIILSVDNYRPTESTAYYDLEEQGLIVDYVIIMGYDEHYSGSEEAGSVASLSWVREGIEAALESVPSEKLINAVPFYTRLWELTPLTDEEIAELDATDTMTAYNVSSKAYGMDNIDSILSARGVEAVWDEECGQYYAEYEEDGNTYEVWLEEEESIALKAALIKEYDLAGISAWKLGFERSTIWDVILKYVN